MNESEENGKRLDEVLKAADEVLKAADEALEAVNGAEGSEELPEEAPEAVSEPEGEEETWEEATEAAGEPEGEEETPDEAPEAAGEPEGEEALPEEVPEATSEPEAEKALEEAPEGKRGLPKRTLYIIAGAAVLLVAVAVSLIVWGMKKPEAGPEQSTSGSAASTDAAPQTWQMPPPETQTPGDGLEQAIALYNESRYLEAIAALDATLRSNSESGQAYMYRGLCQFSLSAYDRAIADLTQALRRLPEADAFVILTYRGAAHVHLQLYPEAIGDLSRAIALEPGNTNAYTYRAKAYEATGRYDLARADMAMAGGDPGTVGETQP